MAISSLPCGCVDQDGGELALVVERQRGRASASRRLSRGSLAGCAEGAVELVARLVAAREPERVARRSSGLPCAVERLGEGDVPFGQRAGLVGEQHLDVAEVLDADEALDDHLSPRQPAGAGRQADGDDRRQQLRRQPDRDREREQRPTGAASGRARR